MNAKVLIVDDNKLNIKILTNILENEGYIVYSSDNSLLVHEIAYQVKPNIILLDIVMPHMNGFEVCALLKRDFELRDIPVIMVTSRTDGTDVKKALELGALDYVRKPVDEGEVIARVQSALRFKQYEEKLKEMAVRDSLTGLYNHGVLVEFLEKELAKQKRKGYGLCFAMIDVDFFKRINDTYGHMAGDEVLKGLADILSKSVRDSDIVGRYGGEEFGIILPEVTRADSFWLCERIRRSIENYEFCIEQNVIRITVSIGICFKGLENSVHCGEIIKQADDALYTSKNSGRNHIEIFPLKSCTVVS